jgi:hypothetical protein
MMRVPLILHGHAELQDALNMGLNTAPESDGLIRLAAVEGEAIDTENYYRLLADGRMKRAQALLRGTP